MWSPKRLLVISFLTLVLGVLMSHRVYRMLQSCVASPASRREDAVIAARDLPAGVTIEDDSTETAKIEAGACPRNCFHDKAMVVGRRIILPISVGEFVVPSQLTAENGDRFFDLSSPSLRAVSVPVIAMRETDFLWRGARVDVLVARMPKDRNDQTTTVLKNIVVLAVGRKIQVDSDGHIHFFPIVTLLVSPNQAQELAFAGVKGHVALSLSDGGHP